MENVGESEIIQVGRGLESGALRLPEEIMQGKIYLDKHAVELAQQNPFSLENRKWQGDEKWYGDESGSQVPKRKRKPQKPNTRGQRLLAYLNRLKVARQLNDLLHDGVFDTYKTG
jgi:hypothetical protein